MTYWQAYCLFFVFGHFMSAIRSSGGPIYMNHADKLEGGKK